MTKKLLSVIIPAYNEEETISTILEKVVEINLINGIEKEIIVVNDCFKDQTVEAVNQFCISNP